MKKKRREEEEEKQFWPILNKKLKMKNVWGSHAHTHSSSEFIVLLLPRYSLSGCLPGLPGLPIYTLNGGRILIFSRFQHFLNLYIDRDLTV